jgi:hypothetical protein
MKSNFLIKLNVVLARLRNNAWIAIACVLLTQPNQFFPDAGAMQPEVDA